MFTARRVKIRDKNKAGNTLTNLFKSKKDGKSEKKKGGAGEKENRSSEKKGLVNNQQQGMVFIPLSSFLVCGFDTPLRFSVDKVLFFSFSFCTFV